LLEPLEAQNQPKPISHSAYSQEEISSFQFSAITSFYSDLTVYYGHFKQVA